MNSTPRLLQTGRAEVEAMLLGRGGSWSRARRTSMSRTTASWGVLLVAMTLTGCVASPDIRLRNPQTGQTFTCSGEAGSTGRWWDAMAKRTRDNCVKDLEARGYVIIK